MTPDIEKLVEECLDVHSVPSGLGARFDMRSALRWLAERLSAPAEKREFAGMDANVGIADRCPTCDRTTLFIGTAGWLTCSSTRCPEPGVSRAIKRLREPQPADDGAKNAPAEGEDAVVVEILCESDPRWPSMTEHQRETWRRNEPRDEKRFRLMVLAYRAGRAEADALRGELEEARERIPWPWCPECKVEIQSVDEDGCCSMCGVDPITPKAEHVGERDDLLVDRERIREERDVAMSNALSLRAELTSVAATFNGLLMSSGEIRAERDRLAAENARLAAEAQDARDARDHLSRQLRRERERCDAVETALSAAHAKEAELVALVARAARDSTTTTGDGPGCFFCDHEEHTDDCPARALLGGAS